MLILGLSHPRFSTSLAFPHKNPPHSHLASPFFSHFFDPANTEVISIDFFPCAAILCWCSETDSIIIRLSKSCIWIFRHIICNLVYWQGSFLERNLSLNEERSTYTSREKSLSYYEKINPIYGQKKILIHVKISFTAFSHFCARPSLSPRSSFFDEVFFLLICCRRSCCGAFSFWGPPFSCVDHSLSFTCLEIWVSIFEDYISMPERHKKAAKFRQPRKKATLNEIVFFTKLIRQTVHLLNDKA